MNPETQQLATLAAGLHALLPDTPMEEWIAKDHAIFNAVVALTSTIKETWLWYDGTNALKAAGMDDTAISIYLALPMAYVQNADIYLEAA